MLSNFFLNRPIFAWVIAIFVIIGGIVSINLLPVSQYPLVAPPTITVTSTYPGADAKTIDETVNSVIEREMNGADGLMYMQSKAMATGIGELSITFAPGTDEDLAQVDTVLSSYTTHFNGGNANRSQNIRIAAGELDQQLIRNGGEFSFNQTVGSRAASAGYRDAAVIIEGKVEQDIGGGVCQVSSTLYNAVLLAGLQSTERTSHFYPSSYVPAGLDATVADGQLDFKFRNVLPHNVYLLSSVYGSTLTIFVLGTRADLDGSRITLLTRTEKPGPGPVVSAYRIYQKNGQEVNREFLHTDHYDVQG